MTEPPARGHADPMATARTHAEALVEVTGVVAVVVGGSHASGTADAGSDLDLGVYYREPLDVPALAHLATTLTGRPTEVAAPGGWGPWVDGGAWLSTDEGPVDWILRDLGRVTHEWERAARGEFGLHHQPGHPFGFLSTTYVGELATAVVVADPDGEVRRLQQAAARYPKPLRDALVGWLWEAEFSLAVARKATGRGDAAYVAMCVLRAVGIMAHALHARAGRWVLNEKGLVAAAGRLPDAPPAFAARAQALCGGIGTTPAELTAALADADRLLADVRGD
ncbi:nucleotidyltransferase domain-containing protein [Actinopolymorpha sp. NPDC004070]|uniref:nucleotidyltransferase domain-containing protein n=1 Tax=Actinopolymorpha sp. NPDC004070 TaxID=3154548 RepID=UPI0033A2397B